MGDKTPAKRLTRKQADERANEVLQDERGRKGARCIVGSEDVLNSPDPQSDRLGEFGKRSGDPRTCSAAY
jgi:hypothetical protein